MWRCDTKGHPSHSTRVRGLKLRKCGPHTRCCPVALYTSAWIEIIKMHTYHSSPFRRTLHECVDWNFVASDKLLNFARRTLHECVDWNACDGFFWKCEYLSHSTRVRGLKFLLHRQEMFRKPVALYTSAWIEIPSSVAFSASKTCRTLHECVDWNRNILPYWSLEMRRTLHECVDWNHGKWLSSHYYQRRTLHECVDWNEYRNSA